MASDYGFVVRTPDWLEAELLRVRECACDQGLFECYRGENTGEVIASRLSFADAVRVADAVNRGLILLARPSFFVSRTAIAEAKGGGNE